MHSGGAAYPDGAIFGWQRERAVYNKFKPWKLARVRQVTGEPETLLGCKGNTWLPNCVGFCEEPDRVHRSQYLIWALDVPAQLSSVWLRNARECVCVCSS